jgi:hypothetical protein
LKDSIGKSFHVVIVVGFLFATIMLVNGTEHEAIKKTPEKRKKH